jgi:Rap1a immunity proteins
MEFVEMVKVSPLCQMASLRCRSTEGTKFMWLLLPALAVALMTSSVEADDGVPRPVFYSGNLLLKACANAEVCVGFVAGVADTMVAAQEPPGGSVLGLRTCIPASVTLGQAKDVAVRYIQEHPESRHYSAAKLVAEALDGAFPCPAK